MTWDSRQSNSYFYHPLGTILTSNDEFSLSFDLLLTDAGTNADGTNALQLAVGFLNLAQAQNTHFLRGSGDNVTNLAEFDFYPGVAGFLPSLDATLIDTNGYYYFAYEDIAWNFGAFYHVTIHHAAGTSALTGQILAKRTTLHRTAGTGANGGVYNEGIAIFASIRRRLSVTVTPRAQVMATAPVRFWRTG